MSVTSLVDELCADLQLIYDTLCRYRELNERIGTVRLNRLINLGFIGPWKTAERWVSVTDEGQTFHQLMSNARFA